jgi:hypothetical protein
MSNRFLSLRISLTGLVPGDQPLLPDTSISGKMLVSVL